MSKPQGPRRAASAAEAGAGSWREGFGTAAPAQSTPRGSAGEGSWRQQRRDERRGPQERRGSTRGGRGTREGAGPGDHYSPGYTSSSDTDRSQEPPANVGVPAGDEAVAELNSRLGAIGLRFRLPPAQQGRSQPEPMRAIVEESVTLLLRMSGSSGVIDLAPVSPTLHALCLALDWKPAPVSDDVCLDMLTALRSLLFNRTDQASRKRAEEEVRFMAAFALTHLVRALLPRRKQEVLSKFTELLPEDQCTKPRASQPHLFVLIVHDRSTRVRMQAANAASALLQVLQNTLSQAESGPRSARPLSFMSYSGRLGALLCQAHEGAAHALRAAFRDDAEGPPPDRGHILALLHLLLAAITVTPYHRVAAAREMLAAWLKGPEVVRMLRADRNTAAATLQVVTAGLNTKRPIVEITDAIGTGCADMLDAMQELLGRRYAPAVRYESMRAWAALARNYPPPVRLRWGNVCRPARDLISSPDHQSRLSVLCLVTAATEPRESPVAIPGSDDLPPMGADTFGPTSLPPGARVGCSLSAEVEAMRRLVAQPPEPAQGGAIHENVGSICRALDTLVLPLLSDAHAAVRGHAVAALANLTPELMARLEHADFDRYLSVVLRALGDDHPTVRGAAARVCGLWLYSARGMAARHRLCGPLVAMLAKEQPFALQQKLGWVLVIVCERLREPAMQAPPKGADAELRRELELRSRDSALVTEVVQSSCRALAAVPRGGKCPWQLLRAASVSGQSSDCNPSHVAEAISCCAGALLDSSVKARWNAAAALNQVLQNTTADSAECTAAVDEAVARLADALQAESNYKVRIQGCWALAAVGRFSDVALRCAIGGVVGAIARAEAEAGSLDFDQLRYKDMLLISLKGVLLHVLRSAVKRPGCPALSEHGQQLAGILDGLICEAAGQGGVSRWTAVLRDVMGLRSHFGGDEPPALLGEDE
eukprot:TRINITY_DN21660_c0_g1_i1.p1 TRINITY_DN21660_c0_g1~~TRINITY_DN21660_c0_g1_i1.p1  ORF type:complete len:939 (+),score=172.17 TRINITY_DN21660_c0_g1_i1:47-2863(+)